MRIYRRVGEVFNITSSLGAPAPRSGVPEQRAGRKKARMGLNSRRGEVHFRREESAIQHTPTTQRRE